MTEAEKGQKYRFTYTSQWELRNLFSVVYIEVTHEAIVTQQMKVKDSATAY